MKTLGRPHPTAPQALAALATMLALWTAPTYAAPNLESALAPRVGPDVATLLPVSLGGGAPPRLAPRLFVGDHRSLWRDSLGVTRFVLQYGSSAAAGARLHDRTDLARALLLPGRWSMNVAIAHALGRPEHVHMLGPSLGFDAKVLSWREDASVGQLGIHDDLGLIVPRTLAITLTVTRAVNLLGNAQRRVGLLPPVGGDGVWVTYLGSSAAYRLASHDLYVTGTYHQYLGDSKFPFPARGRRVLTLGLMKGIGPQNGLDQLSDGAAD